MPSQLGLMLWKDLKVLSRSKKRTLAEIAAALLMSIPIVILIASKNDDYTGDASKFEAFEVTGDWRDINRKIPLTNTIYVKCCMRDVQLGVVFRKNIDGREAEQMVDSLGRRYSNATKAGLSIIVSMFASEDELNKALRNDQENCGRYIGGIVFKELNVASRRLSYVMRMQKLYAKDEPWMADGPFAINLPLPVPYTPNTWNNGFISLQFAVESSFVQAVNGNGKSDALRMWMQRLPEPRRDQMGLSLFMGYLKMFFPVIALVVLFSTVSFVAAEKESAVKPYLEVMGLKPWVFYTSHSIITFVKLAITILPSISIIAYLLKHISSSLFLFITLVFCAGTVSFSMLMTSILHSASGSVKLSVVVWTALLTLANNLQPSREKVALAFLSSFNIVSALGYALDAVKDNTLRNEWLGWLNAFELSTEKMSLGFSVVMMVMDTVWMALLTLYLDQVVPSGELPRKHPLFFLPFIHKSEESGVIAVSKDEVDSANEDIQMEESVANEEEADVQARHLTKLFGSHRAVDSLSFSAHRGKVSVLLGHNGAGKSTTFAMLSGLARPTAGSVRICGTLLTNSTMAECQNNVGFCPQYNPLINRLTAQEHLHLIRLLKGNHELVEDELLSDLGLSHNSDTLAAELSGGMKRKLCMAMSLVGGNKVVLLDEPTAGMDPGARHSVAELLERCKRDRTVILTTHYMDEADLLGDRISIMVKGRLACGGTSSFLKSRFGTGYLLTIAMQGAERKQGSDNDLLDAIRSFVPNAHIQSATAQQMTVLLPVEHKTKFSELFDRLERESTQLGTSSFGLSLNTLEQVFLTVGEKAEPSELGRDSEDMARQQASQICDQSNEKKGGIGLITGQLLALFKKRALLNMRTWWRLVLQVLLPMLLLTLSRWELNKLSTSAAAQEKLVHPSQLAPAVAHVQFKDQIPSFSNNLTRILDGVPGYEVKQQAAESNFTKFLLLNGLSNPPIGVAATAEQNGTGPIKVMAYYNSRAFHGPIISSNVISNARLGISPDSISVSVHPFKASSNDSDAYEIALRQLQWMFVSPVVVFTFTIFTCLFVKMIIEERSCQFLHQQLLTRLHVVTYWASVILSDLMLYVLCCLAYLFIFDFIGWLESHKADAMLLWLLYLWSWLPFIYITAHIFDKTETAEVVLMVISLVGSLAAIVVSYLLKLYYPPIAPIFDTVATVLLPTLTMAEGITKLVATTQQQEISKLMDGKHDINMVFGENITSESGLYEWDKMGRILTALAVSGAIYWAVFCVIQVRPVARFLYSLWRVPFPHPEDTQPAVQEDSDVAQERARVCNTHSAEFALAVTSLNKYFGQLHAVKSLSFGMKPDECFGLLGINGAGKTTTFDMLTGISFPDSGDATIDGSSLINRQQIGFCPQFDALMGRLTPREILELMASLCGYTDVQARVDTMLDAVSLRPQANQLTKYLSGGQRRRLSIGVALISQSRLIILDEPTAGIDPKARRQIWNLLSAVRDQRCAILLTSHSMDECEALCSRIGIMHAGALVAIGAPQHIKSRFGEGYSLAITVTHDDKMSEHTTLLKQKVDEMFPNATLKTLHKTNHLVWQITKQHDDRWSVLFGKLSRMASPFKWVTDYSFVQSTLEEAFLRLSHADVDAQRQNILPLQNRAALDVPSDT